MSFRGSSQPVTDICCVVPGLLWVKTQGWHWVISRPGRESQFRALARRAALSQLKPSV